MALYYNDLNPNNTNTSTSKVLNLKLLLESLENLKAQVYRCEGKGIHMTVKIKDFLATFVHTSAIKQNDYVTKTFTIRKLTEYY